MKAKIVFDTKKVPAAPPAIKPVKFGKLSAYAKAAKKAGFKFTRGTTHAGGKNCCLLGAGYFLATGKDPKKHDKFPPDTMEAIKVMGLKDDMRLIAVTANDRSRDWDAVIKKLQAVGL